MKRSSLLTLSCLTVLLGAACRQDMHDQPKAKPQSKSTFFLDGRTGRPLVEGAVARGDLREDDAYEKGKVDGKFVTALPIPVDSAVMERGRERYNIFCAPCHGQTGLGNGMVVQRGYKTAASHHQDRLRNETNGYWFDVITNGFGVMPGHADKIPVHDRWAIVAYVRALQLSRHAAAADIPEAERQALLSGKTATPAAEHEGKAPAAEAHH